VGERADYKPAGPNSLGCFRTIPSISPDCLRESVHNWLKECIAASGPQTSLGVRPVIAFPVVATAWQMNGTHIAAQPTISPLAIDSTLGVLHYDFV
jgi:hypothetical protein